MKQEEFIQSYWTYYLTLEADFMSTLRYVELNEENFSTFSVEYVKQYQTICSELDVLCKKLCNLLVPTKNPNKMPEYTEIILINYPEIPKKQIKTKNNIILKPWSQWKHTPKYQSPNWWSNYNNVKHNRFGQDEEGNIYFKQANLGNVLNALAGLFTLEMYGYKKISEDQKEKVTIPLPKSQLFELIDWEPNIVPFDSSKVIFEI
ncbi:hypothetical protein [Parageobacillus toebii]|uniref:Uncharacterized protein n=1 Tax=Parageobacillus toebii TaxID=153151 RepID=A0A150N0S2_9BACL|nr:hypothetical protein [Parageobacillus toebii]KYD30315.1 hypothetical protein B4110_3703 [Parageobacillus toebii]